MKSVRFFKAILYPIIVYMLVYVLYKGFDKRVEDIKHYHFEKFSIQNYIEE